MDTNDLIRDIHVQNLSIGWWEGVNLPLTDLDKRDEKLLLITTEISEGVEGLRKGLQDDHLPEYPMIVVELADAWIRCADLIGAMDIRYDKSYMGMFDAASSPVVNIGIRQSETASLMSLNSIISCIFLDAVLFEKDEDSYSFFLDQVKLYADLFHTEYNFFEVVIDKVSYNKSRKDHRLSERAKKGGKKF